MLEVTTQFGDYLLYVDNLETKHKNLKNAYKNLLKLERLNK